jgi:hypothetical protein
MPFYVGKGSAKRAWATDKRSQEWIDKVKSLTDGWEVEIIGEDLSELEAFDLEAEAVDRYGRAKHEGGTLANLVSGGEAPLSARLTVSCDDGGWSEAYLMARTFKDLPRSSQEAFAKELSTTLLVILGDIEQLQEVAEELSDDELIDSLIDLDCIVAHPQDMANEFLRRRVSWKDLGIALEETIDDLQYKQTDGNHTSKAEELLKHALQVVTAAFASVDSGNRAQAEAVANRIAGK